MLIAGASVIMGNNAITSITSDSGGSVSFRYSSAVIVCYRLLVLYFVHWLSV